MQKLLGSMLLCGALLSPTGSPADDLFGGTDDDGGPVGSTTDEDQTLDPEDTTPGWADLQNPQWGHARIEYRRDGASAGV